MDLFVAPTIGFDLLYVVVVIPGWRAETSSGSTSQRHPSADWIARQVTEAIPLG